MMDFSITMVNVIVVNVNKVNINIVKVTMVNVKTVKVTMVTRWLIDLLWGGYRVATGWLQGS